MHARRMTRRRACRRSEWSRGVLLQSDRSEGGPPPQLGLAMRRERRGEEHGARRHALVALALARRRRGPRFFPVEDKIRGMLRSDAPSLCVCFALRTLE